MTDAAGNAAEFDTMAEWTAQAARALGAEYLVPAACRGSGGPLAMAWLLERLAPTPSTRMLDVGAGLGGPAAYARARTGVRPVLLEPQPAACRAARRMFGLDVVRADATALPFAAASFDLMWSLGVVDTLPDHAGFFAEVARCLRPGGSVGLLAYVAVPDPSVEDAAPDDNHFPTRTRLAALIRQVGLEPTEHIGLSDVGTAPDEWTARADEVDREVARRHRGHPVWQEATEQEQQVADLLKGRLVRGELYLLRKLAVPAGNTDSWTS